VLGGLNTYLYVAGDPLRQIDRFGLLGEIPRSPEDALRRGPKEIGSSAAAKLYGKARGMQCAQQCDRLKPAPGRLTLGQNAIAICSELMPWVDGHLLGGDALDACVETCVAQYPKVCSQKTSLICPID